MQITWKQIQNKKKQARLGYELKWISITFLAVVILTSGQYLF